ncbi:response regulator [Pontibacter sp. JH31]|uniref:Response regulator n=1 Tax=Pontibacter aquaedesilientis TaxID=2766980 RepID=A0ABR7XE02_9BACT|nr:response regulator [Pontibacter aquaedesilientis]MBD1396510.1 response regulator [Pontibacter aquaedesilientis]
MIRKVFIIDDDEISLYLTSLILESVDYAQEIHTFMTADDAFASLLQLHYSNMPEVILLDLNMPTKSGWDFLDMLSMYEEKLQNKTCIYILTSSIAECDKSKSETYPLVNGFLHKPLDEDSLDLIARTCPRDRD